MAAIMSICAFGRARSRDEDTNPTPNSDLSMIKETLTRKNRPAITSDRWHVIHCRWTGDPSGQPVFDRLIVSEHEDRAAAITAGSGLARSLAVELAEVPLARRDQVLVRRPAYKSFRSGPRLARPKV